MRSRNPARLVGVPARVLRALVLGALALAVAGCSPDDAGSGDGSTTAAPAVTGAPSTPTVTTGPTRATGSTSTTVVGPPATTVRPAPPDAADDTTTSSSAPPVTDVAGATGATTSVRGLDGRAYELVVPSGIDDEPVPLVMLLHGYTSSGAVQEMYFQLGPLAEQRGFLLAIPDGTPDPFGNQFWNATDACCNFSALDVDDVGHLLAVIDEIGAAHPVDPRRIHLVGHSNGGFMAYRMACEHADVIASIVSLAGATFADPDDCRPTEPVGVVQVHGTLDEVIRFEGGATPGGGAYPGALGTAESWAIANGCDGAPEVGDAVLDLDVGLPGADTTVTSYTGCPEGGAVELWTIEGGSHVPALSDEFRRRVVDALLDRPKPPAG